MNKKKIRKKPESLSLLEDIIFYLILVPLIIIVIVLLWQKVTNPNKIPDILGYKMFIVLDGKMDTSIEYGDLVFTHNIDPNALVVNNVIAFRNPMGAVTIHKIIDIEQSDDTKTFTMKTSMNETNDTKFVKEEDVEGILVHRIANLGLLLLFTQNPWVMLFIISVILIVGLICYYIAQELDKRDMVKLKNEYVFDNSKK